MFGKCEKCWEKLKIFPGKEKKYLTAIVRKRKKFIDFNGQVMGNWELWRVRSGKYSVDWLSSGSHTKMGFSILLISQVLSWKLHHVPTAPWFNFFFFF